jgi:hypothetical protein
MAAIVVDASFVTSLAGSQTLTVGSGRVVGASFESALVGSVNISFVRSRTVAASFETGLVGAVSLTGTGKKDRLVGASFLTGLSGRVNLSGASDAHGMSVCGVVHEILMLWGIGCTNTAPSYAIERAISDLNAALQMVWNQAKDRTYWTNETLTLTLLDGETSINLPNDIQNVTGPCRRSDNKRPLAPLGTMGELDTFSDLYLDGETAEEPVAYHIEREAQSGSDPARCVLHVVPEVQEASVAFLLDVVKEAPRYTVSSLDSCPLIPIPHQYVETLLLPIARYRASGFTMLFNRPERQEVIDREYQEARIALGLADPLPGNAGDNRSPKETAK